MEDICWQGARVKRSEGREINWLCKESTWKSGTFYRFWGHRGLYGNMPCESGALQPRSSAWTREATVGAY